MSIDDDAPAKHVSQNRHTFETKLRRSPKHCPVCLMDLPKNVKRTKLRASCPECRANVSPGNTCIMGLERGTIELTIDCPMFGHGRNVCASLRVNSADAYYEEWRQKVKMKRPPQDESWGARTFGVTDPFGNSIFVIGPIPKSS